MRKSLLGLLLSTSIAATPALADPAQQFQIFSSKLTPVGDGSGGSQPLQVTGGGSGGNCPAGAAGAIQSSDGTTNCVGTVITGLVLGNGAAAPSAVGIAGGLAIAGDNLGPSELIGNSGAAITGTTYAINTTSTSATTNDCTKQLLFAGSGASAWSLGTPTGGCGFDVNNRGSATITITATGNINGSATLVLIAGQWAHIYNDGTTWWAEVFVSSGGGGSPGGANTNVQFNNAGSFGGVSGFTTDTSGNVTMATLALTNCTAHPANGICYDAASGNSRMLLYAGNSNLLDLDFANGVTGFGTAGVNFLGLASSAYLQFGGSGTQVYIQPQAAGFSFSQIGQTGVTLQLGGIASSNAAIKNVGTAIQARLGDDSAFAPFAASGYSAGGTAGVSCSAGTVTLLTMVVTNGIVTHC